MSGNLWMFSDKLDDEDIEILKHEFITYYQGADYWSMVGMASVAMLSLQPVMADTIWDRFSTILQDIYGQVVAISTIVAVTVGAIALLIRMISRNQRAVEEATQWLKRIVVTWIILNSLGFVVAYLQPLIAGGSYSPT